MTAEASDQRRAADPTYTEEEWYAWLHGAGEHYEGNGEEQAEQIPLPEDGDYDRDEQEEAYDLETYEDYPEDESECGSEGNYARNGFGW